VIRILWRLLSLFLRLALVGLAVVVALLALVRYVDPPTTSVQAQRRVESWFEEKSHYQKRHHFVPLAQISPAFQHAVVAAEDGNFYKHHGFDWEQVRVAVDESLEGKRTRGASTISQQLVKNLFLTTHGSFVRKGLEYALVPLAELILGKRRILELYLNEIEWGQGVFGADAAAQTYYHVPAARITREQGARLAAILPAPRKRHPSRMDRYSTIILARMAIVGW
jgi:monofunctional biosynthetic peptidoglycan transglycosylase